MSKLNVQILEYIIAVCTYTIYLPSCSATHFWLVTVAEHSSPKISFPSYIQLLFRAPEVFPAQKEHI